MVTTKLLTLVLTGVRLLLTLVLTVVRHQVTVVRHQGVLHVPPTQEHVLQAADCLGAVREAP